MMALIDFNCIFLPFRIFTITIHITMPFLLVLSLLYLVVLLLLFYYYLYYCYYCCLYYYYCYSVIINIILQLFLLSLSPLLLSLLSCCCCCRPHSTNVLPAESSTRNHVAASSLSPQVARKGSTLSGFVQRSRLEREVGRDLHSNKWEEV